MNLHKKWMWWKTFLKSMSQKTNFWNVRFFKNNELKSFLVRVVNEKSMANQKIQIVVFFCVVFKFNKRQKRQAYMTCVFF